MENKETRLLAKLVMEESKFKIRGVWGMDGVEVKPTPIGNPTFVTFTEEEKKAMGLSLALYDKLQNCVDENLKLKRIDAEPNAYVLGDFALRTPNKEDSTKEDWFYLVQFYKY